MPDWKQLVRQHLHLPELAGTRQELIVEELAGQLEDLRQAALRRGSSEVEAEREALEDIGDWGELSRRIADAERPNHLPARELRRDRVTAAEVGGGHKVSWLADLAFDLRFGVRALRRPRLFAVTALVTLALGLGATTSIFSIVDAVLLEPLPYPESRRIAILWERLPRIERGAVSYPNFLDWRRQARSFEAMAAYRTWTMNLVGRGDPLQVSASLMSASTFQVLGVEPMLGRALRAEDDRDGAPLVAVLSHAFWQSRFGGDPAALGAAISLDDHPFTVVGVMPPPFTFPAGREGTQLYLPIEASAPIRYQEFTTERDSRLGLRVLARARPGVTLEAARAEMEGIAGQLAEAYPKPNQGVTAGVTWLHTWVTDGSRPTLALLMAAVLGLLLVACANVANLLLARLAGREREIALRATLGAGGARIVRMLLAEAAVLWLAGGVLGLAVAWGMTRLLAGVLGGTLPRAGLAAVDVPTAALALALSLVTGCMFGLLPALRARRCHLLSSLRVGGPTVAGRTRHRLRNSLVAAEAALAVVLLVGAGLTLRTFTRLVAADPGLEADNVLAVELNLPLPKYIDTPLRLAFYDGLLEDVRAMPGVRSAATTWMLPFDRRGWQPKLHAEGQPPEEKGYAAMAEGNVVSPGYFGTMRIALLAGRDFGAQDGPDSPPVVIVDELIAARYWPGESAVGKRLKLGGHDSDRPWLEVIGVVGHVHLRGVQNEARWQLYRPEAQENSGRYFVVARTHGDPSTLVEPIRRAVLARDGQLPLASVRTMAESVRATTAENRLLALLVGSFAAAALLLATVGFYGVMAGAITDRTREIAVRMAIGGRARRIVAMVLRQAMIPVLTGLAVGLVLATGLGRFAASMLYGVSPFDPVSFTVAALVVIAVALVAGALPASRAAAVDPNTTLRGE